MTVLYIDADPESPNFSVKLAGIRRQAQYCGAKVVPVAMAESRPARLKEILARERPDGCIVECSLGHEDLPPEFFADIPVVYLDCSPSLYGGRAPMAVHDGAATARLAFRELMMTRSASFALVGWPEGVFWTRIREKTFLAAAREAGIKCRVFPRKAGETDRSARLVRWLSRLPRHCGIFATNDQVAEAVLRACAACGRRVPADISVLGVDNIVSLCEGTSPSLSSIQIDFELAGYRAAELLFRRLVGEKGAGRPATFGPMLTVHRASTGGSRHRGQLVLAAMSRIRSGACTGLRAGDLARELGCSRRLLELRFRESVGRSVLDEIQSVRLERVLGLLRDPRIALDDIPGRSGYPSAAALRKAFRLHFGCSMQEWRRRTVG